MIISQELFERLADILPTDCLLQYGVEPGIIPAYLRRSGFLTDFDQQLKFAMNHSLILNDMVVGLLEFYQSAFLLGNLEQQAKLKQILLVWLPPEFLESVEKILIDEIESIKGRAH